MVMKPVTLPPGRGMARHETAANRICNLNEHDRDGARLLQQCRSRGCVCRKNKFGLRLDEFFRASSHRFNVGSGPARVDPDIAALRPPELLEFLPERRGNRPSFRRVLGKVAHQHPDASHALFLLRPRRERPTRPRAGEKGDELPPLHLLLLETYYPISVRLGLGLQSNTIIPRIALCV